MSEGRYSHKPGEKSQLYTLEEAMAELDREESTLLRDFNNLQKNLAKKGIFVTKYGGGQNAKFRIEYGEPIKNSEKN